MYPLVLILLPAVVSYERNFFKYSFPLCGVGWLVSLYHNLIYFSIVPERMAPCSMGVSCKSKFVQWIGFIDIPQLSLLAFTILLILFVILWRVQRNEK